MRSNSFLYLNSSKPTETKPQTTANHMVAKRIPMAANVADPSGALKTDSMAIIATSVDPIPPGSIEAAPASMARG